MLRTSMSSKTLATSAWNSKSLARALSVANTLSLPASAMVRTAIHPPHNRGRSRYFRALSHAGAQLATDRLGSGLIQPASRRVDLAVIVGEREIEVAAVGEVQRQFDRLLVQRCQ